MDHKIISDEFYSQCLKHKESRRLIKPRYKISVINDELSDEGIFKPTVTKLYYTDFPPVIEEDTLNILRKPKAERDERFDELFRYVHESFTLKQTITILEYFNRSEENIIISSAINEYDDGYSGYQNVAGEVIYLRPDYWPYPWELRGYIHNYEESDLDIQEDFPS